jgi:cell division protein FtsB
MLRIFLKCFPYVHICSAIYFVMSKTTLFFLIYLTTACCLIQAEKVTEKTFGKKKLYFLKQTKVDATKLLEQRNSLNERNMVLDRELTTIEQLVKSLEGDMKQQLDKIKQDPDNELSSSDISEQTSQVNNFVKQKAISQNPEKYPVGVKI